MRKVLVYSATKIKDKRKEERARVSTRLPPPELQKQLPLFFHRIDGLSSGVITQGRDGSQTVEASLHCLLQFLLGGYQSLVQFMLGT